MKNMTTIRETINLLNYHTALYDQGKAIWSDKEWDDLYFELEQKEKETGIIYPDSPTQSIHYEVVSKLEKVKHDHLMLSLDKTKEIDEVKTFLHGESFLAMFKMDGLTCSLTYENGELVKAETRGNGEVGENILHNAKVVKNIPFKISYKERLVVDGEIICKKNDFIPFENEYKNPRNFAAGSIRLLSAKECASRNLSFIAWDVIEGFDNLKFLTEKLTELNKLGFATVPYAISKDVNMAFSILDGGQAKKDKEKYPIDGYVFKFNDIAYGKSLGQTDHHFKNAIAYKFYDESYETELQDIEWTMGRTGVLTPVAIFKPIDIDGTTVERASLHNVSVMRETLGRYPEVDQKIWVIKANMIIPQIVKAEKNDELHDHVLESADCLNCPICGEATTLEKSKDGILNLYCSNALCDGKFINRLNHFCGKKGLDIKGLSKATFEKLIDWGWVGNLEEVFSLSNFRNEWIKKQGFGVASVDKILKAIEDGKHTTLDKFISALGIPLIGQTAARNLAKNFKTYEEFRNAVNDKNYYFFDIENFGEEMNHSLKKFNYDEADRISKFIYFESPVVNNNKENNSLEGKTIVITGKLTNFKNRNELKEVILAHGGKVSDSISGKTSILINNDVNSTSSKNKAAKQRGIPIMSELDFIEQYIEN